MIRILGILCIIGSVGLIVILFLLMLLVPVGPAIAMALVGIAINACVLWFCTTTRNFHVPLNSGDTTELLDGAANDGELPTPLGQGYWVFGGVALLAGAIIAAGCTWAAVQYITYLADTNFHLGNMENDLFSIIGATALLGYCVFGIVYIWKTLQKSRKLSKMQEL